MSSALAFKELVAAAAQINGIEQVDHCVEESPSTAALTAFVNQNTAAFVTARQALAQPCAMELRFDQDSWAEYWNDLLPLRQLARAWGLQAKLAADDQDWEAVERIGLDLLALANATRRGGLITGQLVAVAIAAAGLETLRRPRTQFTEPQWQSLFANLLRLEAERETFAMIAERDDRWEAIVRPDESALDLLETPHREPEECGISHEAQQAVREYLVEMGKLPKSFHRATQATVDNGDLARLRLLYLDLALRSHQAATGAYPEDLADLAWRFVDGIPPDPFTNRPFVYRRTTDGFMLYSTGPKLTDAGGKFGSWRDVMQQWADLCLDAGDYATNCDLQ